MWQHFLDYKKKKYIWEKSVKFRQNLFRHKIWSSVILLLFLALFHFSLFSFLPHIFLVIDCQWSCSANRRENCKILTMLFEILWKNAKIRDENFLKYWGLSGAKACKSCRSRQELSNEYLLAKIGFDTAENEPFNFHNFSSLQGFDFHQAVVSQVWSSFVVRKRSFLGRLLVSGRACGFLSRCWTARAPRGRRRWTPSAATATSTGRRSSSQTTSLRTAVSIRN